MRAQSWPGERGYGFGPSLLWLGDMAKMWQKYRFDYAYEVLMPALI